MGYGFKIMVEGDYACFSRPECKVERVSYDVPTPGALEGLIKSIYWKPAVRYVIDRIVVFNPINFVNIRRNEVKDKVLLSAVRSKMKGAGGDPSVYASDVRNQRASMVLKNVMYGVEFHFEMTGLRNEKDDECEAKHASILRRRLEGGQYFRTPCLGCAEFPVRRLYLVDEFPMEKMSGEVHGAEDVDLGYMLYRMKFRDGGVPRGGDWEHPKFSDAADAVYYRPHMKRGVIDVCKYTEEVIC